MLLGPLGRLLPAMGCFCLCVFAGVLCHDGHHSMAPWQGTWVVPTGSRVRCWSKPTT